MISNYSIDYSGTQMLQTLNKFKMKLYNEKH